MARVTTTAQAERLAAYDRETHAFIEIEDADGNYQDIGNIQDEDFFDALTIEASSDQPISSASLTLWRASEARSLVPLMEDSPLNVDSTGAYAPLLNPVRGIRVKVATMLPGETPADGDKVLLWEGLIDEIDWARELIRIEARDPMARLNDTIISTTTTYGDDGGGENIDDVMQDILDDVFGASVYPLTVVGTPTLAIAEYELGNVSVLEALKALADLIGWNLHWRWDAAESEFRLTFYEPDRDNVTPSYTFGPDDYYDVSAAALGVAGIRNVGEVVYTDGDGDQQTVTDTRAGSVAIYGERFIRIDAQGTSIINGTQADALLESVLDDLESPQVLQEIDAALHWPIELGDVHTYSANGVHYDSDQTYACFAYRHEITPDRVRTVIQASGKPSGGFKRWLARAGVATELPPEPVYDLRVTMRAETIPTVSGTVRGATWDIHYDLGVDVTHVTWLAWVGLDLVDGGNQVVLPASTGTIRVGAFRTTGQLYVSMAGILRDGSTVIAIGEPVNDLAPDLADIGATRLALSAGGVAAADYAVAGSGILIDSDSAGRPRISRDPTITYPSGDAVTDKILHEATVSWGSLAANSITTTTVSVTGAATGDAVFVAYRSGGFAAFPITGYVSSVGTVTLVVANPESTSRTHNSVAVTIMIVKYTT